MKTPSLAIYGFGYQLDKIRYPWRESIASALALADRVYFCACDPETEAATRELFESRVHRKELVILRRPWGSHCSVQVEIANFILDYINGQFDYAMKLDADEVLHEDSFDGFRQDLASMAQDAYWLGRPHYTHLLNEKLETDFIYRSKAVISKTAARLRFTDNDACAIGARDISEFQTRLEVFHFGKWMPGRRQEALIKEIEFTKLYGKSFGFPDQRVVSQIDQGYIDYERVFEVAASEGHVRPWNGTHPVFVQEWVKRSLEREQEFMEKVAQGKVEELKIEKWWE